MTEMSAAEILSKWRELLAINSVSMSTMLMRQWLCFHGYHQLGSGMYGSAWLTPSKNVIKVNFSMQGAKDGWWLWATQSLEFPGNPWMPAVHSILRDGDYYVAHVELLTAVRMEEENILPYRDASVKIPTDPDFTSMIDLLIDLRMEHGNIYGKYRFKEDYIVDMKNQFDLHRGNWMWRKDQLVLNDPLNSMARSISETAAILCMAQAA